MLARTRQVVFASRATEIIIAACRRARRRVVLLPALYCADVAGAIEAAGLSYRCYDVPSDLSSASATIAAAIAPDIGSIVVLHPFGLKGSFDVTMPGETLLIEDACHALRTSCSTSEIGARGDVTIYSPRKELGWTDGGIATGPLARSLQNVLAPAPHVARQWRASGIEDLAREGQRWTQLAFRALGCFLPPLKQGVVLTALPLKSPERDSLIARLRARGIPAWRWIRPLKGTGPRLTPQAWKLRQQLLLVPLADDSGLERTLDLLSREPLEPWN
jgi:hypothetical protein